MSPCVDSSACAALPDKVEDRVKVKAKDRGKVRADLEQFHVLMHQAATLVFPNRDWEEDAKVVAEAFGWSHFGVGCCP